MLTKYASQLPIEFGQEETSQFLLALWRLGLEECLGISGNSRKIITHPDLRKAFDSITNFFEDLLLYVVRIVMMSPDGRHSELRASDLQQQGQAILDWLLNKQ